MMRKELARDALALGRRAPRPIICRSHLYLGTVVVGFANGASGLIAASIASHGLTAALLNMLGVSIVVWLALGVVLWLLLQAEDDPARPSDLVACGMASVAFLLPVPQLSWAALTAIAIYVHLTSPAEVIRRAAAVLGALTVPMLWARVAFAIFSGPILAIDAKMVSWIVGTRSDGNAVPFADGSGMLFLEPACSSLTNLSLSLLCGVAVVKLYDLPWSPTVLRVVAAAGLTTVVINVIRISAIGVLPGYYDVIHGPIGVSASEWTTNLAVAAILARGLRPHVPAHA